MLGFGNGVHVLVRGASHDDELWLGNPEVAAHVAGFIAGRRVLDTALDVPPPTMARGKLGLLMQTMEIGRGVVLAAIGLLVAVVLIVWVLLRKWRQNGLIRASFRRG